MWTLMQELPYYVLTLDLQWNFSFKLLITFSLNITLMKKIFTISLLAIVLSLPTIAQTVRYDSGTSLRNNKLAPYFKMVTWDDSQYKEFNYRSLGSTGSVIEFMNWRAIFPPGYDKSNPQKYPMIIMLHGAGESGRSWQNRFVYLSSDERYDNNGNNLYHGGQAHRDAVNMASTNSKAFPGVVIFPQVHHSGAWESGWNSGSLNPNGKMAIKVIEHMINNYNIDINKVYLHGLSNGAKGVWDLSTKRPDLFAAILPMSGLASNSTEMTNTHVTTPLWLFQGGIDTNPSPTGAQTLINTLTNKGGSPRYTLYPTTGHSTWYQAYAEPDFFSWILAQDKRKIYVFGGDPFICQGDSLKMGFSAGFSSYQWTLNGSVIAGSNSRYLKTVTPGTYTVKFMRTNNQWYESFPINVQLKSGSTTAPLLTNTGSVVLPIDINAQNVVNLVAPDGFVEYNWYKNGSKVATTTTNTRNISTGTGSLSQAGNYTVNIKESSGCQSQISNIIKVVYTSPHVGPTAPTLSTPIILSSTQASLKWSDSPGEEYYEIWRYRRAVNGYTSEAYKLVGKVGANTLGYIDTGVRPMAQYFYRIRAIGGNDGKFSNEKVASLSEDTILPTAPSELQVSPIIDMKATVSWLASTDNDLIAFYEIFLESTLSDSTTTNSYSLTNLVAGSTYRVGVRAVDGRGNRSTSTTIVFSVASGGLNYKYYEPTISLTSLATFDFSVAPTKTGVVNNFDISVRNRNDKFVFSFDGFIQIDVVGTYTFFTSSDDGSRLYINGVMVVDNDGLHATVEKSGNYAFTTIGKHPIKVTFFEGGGGEVLKVSYDPAGSAAKQVIPAATLFLMGDSKSSSARLSQDESITESDKEVTNSEVEVYPNPFSDRITVSNGSVREGEIIRIYNQMGLLVKTVETQQTEDTTIELQYLPKGIYYLMVGDTKIRMLKRE